MITNNRNSTATQHVTFPKLSSVTQYPVEHIGDFFKMFGVNHGWGEPEKGNVISTGQDLTMAEWDFIIPRRLIFIIDRPDLLHCTDWDFITSHTLISAIGV